MIKSRIISFIHQECPTASRLSLNRETTVTTKKAIIAMESNALDHSIPAHISMMRRGTNLKLILSKLLIARI